MARLRDFFKRITGVSTPLGGISWSPSHKACTGNPLAPTNEAAPIRRFSDGDWITAAIVAPDRAVSLLQTITGSLKLRKNASRQKRMDEIHSAVAQEISALRSRYEAGGETVEDRCEACIAKCAADILDREMTAYRWKLNQSSETDPLDALNGVIRSLITKGAG